jgi:hypothetical protein
MAIPPKQIGQSVEANLLWNISKQLDNLKKTSSIVDPVLLAKIDELITISSKIELSTENINLNTDDLEALISEGNVLLEEIKNNSANSFDGQLTQGGNPVSDTNPLPVTFTGSIETPVLSDTTFQDSTGQLFVYRDNGIDTPIAYKIPEWTVYTPVGAVTATALPLPTDAASETTLALIEAKTDNLDVPLSTRASAANQTNGFQRTKITDGTLDASLLQGGAGYVGLLTSVGPALFLSSTANSSTAQLAPSATFTGTIETVFSQPAIQINMVSDQPMVVTINQYIDAAGLKRSGAYAYSIPAGAGFDMCLPMAGNYFNVTVQNIGAATTTTFTLDVTYGTMQAVDTYGAQTISVTQLAYGTANAVYVGGTSQVQVTPTVTSASAYATGNIVGGLLTFPNIVNSTVKSGVLESITIAVKSLQTTSFKLYIFSGLPSTTFNNKTTPAIVVGDASKLLDVYSFTTPDNGLGNNVTLYYSDAINRSLVLDGSSMYGVLVCLGTPTFTTTTDVVVTASILRD